MNKIINEFKTLLGVQNVREEELMKNHTSFEIGGPCEVLLLPKNIEELSSILKLCAKHEIPYFIMGNGTNLLVNDKGIRGIVIKLLDNFNSTAVNDNIITAQSGVLLSKLSDLALSHSLTGLEFACGIPGTLGGAVAMNAGAYNGEIKDVVVKTCYMDKNGEIKTLEGIEHEFGYRTSFIQKQKGIVLTSEVLLKKGNLEEIKLKMQELDSKRKEKQPLNSPSAGSVFKRPEGFYTGKLIEDCGLKGYRIGGAEVSNMHCGFIVNAGNATYKDVIMLIEYIKEQVFKKFGVEIETEIRIVN